MPFFNTDILQHWDPVFVVVWNVAQSSPLSKSRNKTVDYCTAKQTNKTNQPTDQNKTKNKQKTKTKQKQKQKK